MGSDQFWNSTSIEPKRQHKWLVYLHNSNIPSYVARKVDKPSFSINEQQHKYFGHTFKYPGQVTWDDITMTLVDPIDPNVSDKLQEVLINSGYRTPDNRTNNALLYELSSMARNPVLAQLPASLILLRRGKSSILGLKT
jgi:hypothetical protein